MDLDGVLHSIFNFENYGELLVLVQNSIWAGAVLGLLGGLVGTFVMKRDLAFAVHGISELSFAGAAFALLIGADVVARLARRVRGGRPAAGPDGRPRAGQELDHRRDHAVRPGPGHPVPLPLRGPRGQQVRPAHRARSCPSDTVQLQVLAGAAVVVMLALVAIWRPLTFASVDPEVAAARGVPVRGAVAWAS